ncbi:MAG TPA: alkaline phosphatase [Bacteroidota bacterium]|nr:alkaline phosphatase [Bacteroidota bacterium]
MKNFQRRFNMSVLLLCVIIYFIPLNELSCQQYVLQSQNVFLVVIDGARYSETFGGKEKYIPKMWKELRPLGTIYTNFHNEGTTATIPGHLAMETGNWQKIANDGSERCSNPTLFEYYRKQKGGSDSSCFVVSGKKKLHVLTHSIDSSYGSQYQATFVAPDEMLDIKVWMKLVEVIDQHHPRFVLINFPEVDKEGHDGNWNGYLRAIRQVDSLVFLLWQKIQGDSVYKNTTTMFVTNDHGRHDEQHGGFQHHGDSCEGCRHIMLLTLGPLFSQNTVISDKAIQVDVAATIADIFKLKLPSVQAQNLLYQSRSSESK